MGEKVRAYRFKDFKDHPLAGKFVIPKLGADGNYHYRGLMWGPQGLENEVARGLWKPVEVDPDEIGQDQRFPFISLF